MAAQSLHARTLSFGRRARAVSYEEMCQVGLAKPLDEFYKLLNSNAGAKNTRKATESTLAVLLRTTIARPLPGCLTPEALIAAAARLWIAIAVALHHTAVLSVQLALWYVCGSSGASQPGRQLWYHAASVSAWLQPGAGVAYCMPNCRGSWAPGARPQAYRRAESRTRRHA